MGIFEEIKKMQDMGKSDQDIILLLQESGYGIKEASDAVAQARIKQAVSSQQDPTIVPQYENQDQEMMQSIVNQPSQIPAPIVQEEQKVQPQQQYPQYQQEQQYQTQQEQQMQYSNQDYNQQYQQYDSSSSSADVITEIAEQIVSEKMSVLRKQLEIIIDLKNTNEAKLISIDERLKRLEKVIDHIQLSILQKVGEYVTNVEDIKKEMIESQKSFKTLLGSKGHKTDFKQL